MRVFVTGADGFIGSALVRHLRALGTDVFGYSRRVSGDLLDFPLETALSSYDVVVHLAGLAHVNADRAQFIRANVAVTERIARASVVSDVAHFIYVSSLGTLAPTANSPYVESKRRAEESVRHIRKEGVTIVRPALVYGPGDLHGNFIRLIRRIDAGRLIVVSKMAKKHLVYIESLVAEVTRIGLAKPPPGHQVLNAFDDVVCLETMVQVIGKELGREVKLVSVPQWAASLAVTLTRCVGETSFGRDVWRVMTGGDYYGSSGEETSGPMAGPGFTTGVQQTIEWYRALPVSSPEANT